MGYSFCLILKGSNRVTSKPVLTQRGYESKGSTMREIVEVIPRDDYRLEIGFDDRERAIVDVKPLMNRKVFRPLTDKSFFRQVEIDHKFGGIRWPNGADVCIDRIEAEIARQKPEALYA